jgi:hypothetical protein
VTTDLMSVRQALRSPSPSIVDSRSGREESTSFVVHLSPATHVTPLVEEGKVRPLSPNKLYLLRQGII